MTWWSEHSTVPRFVLAKSAIRCRWVDRFVGSRVPSHVSGQRFSTRGASLPSAGSRRARFPVVIGTMKALRLPARAHLLPHGFGHRPHALLLCSCSPKRSQQARRALVRPGTLAQPAFHARHVAPVGASGISQVSWRSVPCLCPAPRPRPSRHDLALAVLPMPPPDNPRRRPQLVHNIEANTGLQHPLSTLHERRRRLPCKTRFRLAGCAFAGRASNPLDRYRRFQVLHPSSFPGLRLSQGSSMRSPRSLGRRRCSPISRATRTGLRSRTAA